MNLEQRVRQSKANTFIIVKSHIPNINTIDTEKAPSQLKIRLVSM